MKKFITLLIGCSLALVVSAQAEQKNAKKKPAQPQHAAPAKKQQHAAPAQKQQHAAPAQKQQHAAPAQKQQHAAHAQKQQHAAPAQQHADKNKSVQASHVQHQQMPAQNHVKTHGGNVAGQQLNAPSNIHPNKMPKAHGNQLPAAQANSLPAVQSNNRAAAGTNTLPAVQANRRAAAQTVRAQHSNFHARPNTNVASVQYNQNYRITGAENWRGANYDVFRSYHPVWHDRTWWNSNYARVSLIGGGWYFLNAGYWYPAWGYDSAAAYYPYDGPIYVGESGRSADQVVADVQALLQQEGYYRGEVDGLLGPMTRDALGAYQAAQGLEPTAAIDEPTLESLGLA